MKGKNGAPEEIRTPDPQIRSLVLYPAELRVRGADGQFRLRGDPLKAPVGECKSNFAKNVILSRTVRQAYEIKRFRLTQRSGCGEAHTHARAR